MAEMTFAAILAMACLFMVYALVQFWLETKRPRRAPPRSPDGIVAFRKTTLIVSSTGHDREVACADDLPVAEKSRTEMTSGALLAGMHRLAAKRAARS
jgi:hypothetical protein